jgi:flagellar assembly protein FliH
MGSVIRRERFAAAPRMSFDDFEREAHQALEAARQRARQILQNAEQQARRSAEQRYREAHQRGIQEGREAGLEQARRDAQAAALAEARRDLANLQAALAEALEGFDRAKRRLLAQAERGVIELAVAIARRVCKHDALRSSEAVRANARHLLELAGHEHDLVLRVHPAEFESLQALGWRDSGTQGSGDSGSQSPDSSIPQSLDLQHAQVVADESVDRGGCVLASRAGTIDATLEKQIDRIATAIAGAPTERDPATG